MGKGPKVLQAMRTAWQTETKPQRWLYVWDGAYAVADDYFWIALVEQRKPEFVAAQILGEPLSVGLRQKSEPLPLEQVRAMLELG